jgi:hypothetical protein
MVWLEQIETTFYNLVKDKVRVYDSNGILVPVDISYAQGEGEGEQPINETLPKITLRLYDLRVDLERLANVNTGMRYKSAETVDTVTMKEYPMPYWLYYEFIVIAEYQEDVNAIVTQLQCVLPPRGTLLVPDSIDSVDTGLYMELIQYLKPKKMDTEKTTTEERLVRRLKSVLRYRLTAELDRENIEQYYKVKALDLSVYYQVQP